MPTNLWDPAGRECGRTFLYLHFCSYGKRPSLEPHCGILLHGCRNLVFFSVLNMTILFIFWSLVSTTFDIIGSPTPFSRSTTRGSTLGLIV